LVIVHVFQKRLYDFQKRLCVFKDYIIVHPISSDAGCDGVAKDELYSSDSFLNKNWLFGILKIKFKKKHGWLKFDWIVFLFNLEIVFT